ncbi:GMC family oxidoreductase [Aquabacter spiritensis]|uniref:Gluconate 2-dehydrogenase alpha chain n=1 Tax=Aquabacter spiritensis TaxID=933073 RepID=A0A4R3LPU1_9HYPH|nr:GMC family oxidoreductase [Aquabacter spiritensis]TCT01559.1 gluconate 2-dehydrogenase alpha chain [Aquabacter spiritensis]
MAVRMPPVDVALVGGGMTAAILGKELAEAGHTVVALERGQMRQTIPDFQSPTMHDELKYSVRHGLMQDPRVQTLSFRNFPGQRALPMRQLGSFLPGEGVGGAMVHWNGQTWRFQPEWFALRSWVNDRYGRDFLAEDVTIQDWGLSYEDLEPFYDYFERICGTGGTAGNLRGEVQSGGNPFEGARSAPYPNPPMKQAYSGHLFGTAAAELGHHPFPVPSSNSTRHYTNPYGLELKPCMYCGFCETYGCEHFAKASAQVAILPAALANKNFELRTRSYVLRVEWDRGANVATGVTYVDARGREVFQPAAMVVLCAFAHHNAVLMLQSGIGEPYDPRTRSGTVGRNYTYQTMSGINVFYAGSKRINPFMGAGALGTAIDDVNNGSFDHSGLGFVGGAYIAAYQTSGRPINFHPVPDGTPRWGRAWKQAVAENYNSTVSLTIHGSSVPHPNNYIGLDPSYTDAFGQPLGMVTFDFPYNDRLMSRHVTEKAWRVAQAMGGKSVSVGWLDDHYSIVPYQTTHNTGGTIMGTDPKTSVVNRYLQSWDMHNLWVMGAGVFPQNAGYNPTGTVGALTYWALDAMLKQYLRNPRPLVPS